MLRDKLNDGLDASSQKHLDTIIHSSQRMARLIDDLLSFSRLSNSGVEFENVDLNKILQQVISDLEIPIKEKNAEVQFEDMPVIKGIPIQLGQLFQNLISNSLKFSHPDRTPLIYIKTENAVLEKKRAIRIIYKDNGIGFKQNQAEKIFEIFYRLHNKEQYEGTGVGLAIVKKIVEFHHGVVHAKGEENEGVCFEILIPHQPVVHSNEAEVNHQ